MKLQKMWRNIAIILLSVTLVVCSVVLFATQSGNNDKIFGGGTPVTVLQPMLPALQ